MAVRRPCPCRNAKAAWKRNGRLQRAAQEGRAVRFAEGSIRVYGSAEAARLAAEGKPGAVVLDPKA